MPQCLLGLGSNLGDRRAVLDATLAAIGALPDVQLRKHSEWIETQPVGGPEGQAAFLNGAALVNTTIAPLILLAELQRIEQQLGRTPTARWAARPIDIDMLLYDLEVLETAMIVLPHPRMTFRRFVLEPAATIAPKMIHPVIGWPIERLRLHLDAAADQVAIVSPSEARRRALAESVGEQFGALVIEPPALGTAAAHWPAEWTTWLAVGESRARERATLSPGPLPYAAAAFPKLTVLLDGDATTPRSVLSKWTSLIRQPGRGPTLRLFATDVAHDRVEVFAALQSVWPDLGLDKANRLE